jgi:hypothetical protein
MNTALLNEAPFFSVSPGSDGNGVTATRRQMKDMLMCPDI